MAATGRVIGVVVDKSDSAEKAFRWAAHSLYKDGDTVVAMHCYVAHITAGRAGIGDGLATSESVQEEQEKIDAMLRHLIETLTTSGKKGYSVKSRIAGSAGESIEELGTKENVNMLVTRLNHAVDYLIRHAPFPVIIHHDGHN